MNLNSMVHPVYGLYLMLIIGGGIAAVRAKSLVRALTGLIVTLFGVAGMYLLLAAPFIAFMQILIYVGAVAVLMFFAIMLTRTSDGESGFEDKAVDKTYRSRGFMSIWASGLTFAMLAMAVVRYMPRAIPLKPETTMAQLGEFLTGPFVLPFELISVALLVSMAGAVLLGFERRKAK